MADFAPYRMADATPRKLKTTLKTAPKGKPDNFNSWMGKKNDFLTNGGKLNLYNS